MMDSKASQLIARLKTVLSRAQHEELSKCDRCDAAHSHELSDCLKCNGTGWVTKIKQERLSLTPPEIPVAPEVLQALEGALRQKGRGHLGTFGFLDVTIRPYGGMYSNPYPYGEPYEVRIIKSNYHEQQRQDARALASCEAAYLAAPDDHMAETDTIGGDADESR